jgi:hypothetical protein
MNLTAQGTSWKCNLVSLAQRIPNSIGKLSLEPHCNLYAPNLPPHSFLQGQTCTVVWDSLGTPLGLSPFLLTNTSFCDWFHLVNILKFHPCFIAHVIISFFIKTKYSLCVYTFCLSTDLWTLGCFHILAVSNAATNTRCTTLSSRAYSELEMWGCTAIFV